MNDLNIIFLIVICVIVCVKLSVKYTLRYIELLEYEYKDYQ
jgi:hypothetical protein